MKPNLITSFAAGLLLSATVCGAVYFSKPSPSGKSAKQVVKAPTEEQMKDTLSNSGYIILTNKEWEKQLAATKEEKPQKETEQETKETTKETIVYRTVVNVAQGMTSIDVGNALVRGKIIDNARDFFNEVEKRGLSNKLKPGTFELDSNMTMDEVIAVIFK
ncbi:hypothetical protein [Robertmurraya andreesenii]|uniref:Aminodeoxychorismate lyase n=1 Tax=Anoxybacillus andreesenii TaxID=1325932 RepID=A0ABT9V0S6_9BACL|nr:hypothetical protein [Robertmurraya andreesenii]MDQ0154551.1 hypothetical protein [Robertmurraya andreesenii]